MLTFIQYIYESKYSARKDEHKQLWYHVTPHEFEGGVLPMTHFGTADQVRDRADTLDYNKPKSKTVHIARLKLKNGFEIEDSGEQHTHEGMVDELTKRGLFSNDESKKLKDELKLIVNYNKNDSKASHRYCSEHLAREISKRGYDHLFYKNNFEGNVDDPNNKSVVILHPKKQVRTIGKKYNPRIRQSRMVG